ncbi:regulatory subunit of cyclin-dependent kinase [Mycena olivaceomarginata]|nr:regulatory subunit of cyclin-dependent kinase [Mycena olivaceomarginata]
MSSQLTKEQEEEQRMEALTEKIQYSDRYSDDLYEYRHVVLPKPLLRLVPKDFFTQDGRTLRLLADAEWRGIGIMQSLC